MIKRIYVIYDDHCGFCSRCAIWLRQQPQLTEIVMVAHTEAWCWGRFAGLKRLPEAELTVIDDGGGIYYGDNAWLMTIWALRAWRPWAARFASPELKPMARTFFELLSSSRHTLSWLLGLRGDADIAAALRKVAPPGEQARCGEEGCSLDDAGTIRGTLRPFEQRPSAEIQSGPGRAGDAVCESASACE